jgi:hypothetical protein
MTGQSWRQRAFDVWVMGEFFGTVRATTKASALWFVATVIRDDYALSGAETITVKPR